MISSNSCNEYAADRESPTRQNSLLGHSVPGIPMIDEREHGAVRRPSVARSHSDHFHPPLGRFGREGRRRSFVQAGNSAKVDLSDTIHTVKSAMAYFSPVKSQRRQPVIHSTIGIVNVPVAKTSPTSVSEFDASCGLDSLCSTSRKASISSPDRSVLQQFPGFDDSASFHISSGSVAGFIEVEEETEISASFALDEGSIFPSSIRLAASNGTLPSDMSSSTTFGEETKDSTPTSPTRQKSCDDLSGCHNHSLSAEVSRATSDSIPLKPCRQQSRHSSTEREPIQAYVGDADTPPQKPSRQLSSRCLNLGRKGGLSCRNPSLYSIDSSPSKPQRQSSQVYLMKALHDENIVRSGLSTDFSPMKPKRQLSARFSSTITRTQLRSKSDSEAVRRHGMHDTEDNIQTQNNCNVPFIRQSIEEEPVDEEHEAQSKPVLRD